MKIDSYKCNVCNTELADTKEFIGLGIKESNGSLPYDFYPQCVEQAKYHVCSVCLIALKEFAIQWENKDKMSPAAKHAWGMDW